MIPKKKGWVDGGNRKRRGKVRVHGKTVAGCFGINSTICRA
jgi:hypothetical protein